MMPGGVEVLVRIVLEIIVSSLALFQVFVLLLHPSFPQFVTEDVVDGPRGLEKISLRIDEEGKRQPPHLFLF